MNFDNTDISKIVDSMQNPLKKITSESLRALSLSKNTMVCLKIAYLKRAIFFVKCKKTLNENPKSTVDVFGLV